MKERGREQERERERERESKRERMIEENLEGPIILKTKISANNTRQPPSREISVETRLHRKPIDIKQQRKTFRGRPHTVSNDRNRVRFEKPDFSRSAGFYSEVVVAKKSCQQQMKRDSVKGLQGNDCTFKCEHLDICEVAWVCAFE